MAEWSAQHTSLKEWSMNHFQKRVASGFGEFVQPPTKEELVEDAKKEAEETRTAAAEFQGEPGYARARVIAMNRGLS